MTKKKAKMVYPIDSREPHFYLTSGVRVNLHNLRDEEKSQTVLQFQGRPDLISDFVIPLSRIPRFAGHTGSTPWSVLDHSCLAAFFCYRPEDRLAALTHDFVEAITSDIPSPVKALISGFRAWERRAHDDIMRALGLPVIGDHRTLVRLADRDAGSKEFEYFHAKTTKLFPLALDSTRSFPWFTFDGMRTWLVEFRQAIEHSPEMKPRDRRRWSDYLAKNEQA